MIDTKARYRVRTWDPELGEWTPQIGLSLYPADSLSPGQLKKTIRELRDMCYSADRDDAFVLVERIN